MGDTRTPKGHGGNLQLRDHPSNLHIVLVRYGTVGVTYLGPYTRVQALVVAEEVHQKLGRQTNVRELKLREKEHWDQRG